MTQDFAKRHRTQSKAQAPVPSWAWFVTGLIAGIFISFLAYLWKVVPADPETVQIKELPKAQPDQLVEEMTFDFYDLFPKSEVPIVEEYNIEGLRVESAEPFDYLLQAGSFRNPNDANQLRAELILLGLEVFIKEIKVDDNQWHRVMVGPLASDLLLNRAQDKLAAAEIESIPFRVKR
ncbi:MAG: SPOR domain-containing protein [Pseudomonadales bacterium]|jgi:cell division protein FtsN